MSHSGFGPQLKSLRQELGLSQGALALALDSTQRHVSFLETGRSAPSREMVGRIATSLSLSAGQRATLFEASGFHSPYPRRAPGSEDVKAALDMMERQIIGHWPFPGFVLDAHWNVLRSNQPGQRMLATVGQGTNGPANILEMLLSDAMRPRIVNWEEASAAIYFRLQHAATRSTNLANVLERAKRRGVFTHVLRHIISQEDVPIFVPIELDMPGIGPLRISSLLGHLASVHDSVVEGCEVELVVPIDEAAAEGLRTLFG